MLNDSNKTWRAVLLIKDIFKTKFLQTVDMFEGTKFVGRSLTVELTPRSGEPLVPQKLLFDLGVISDPNLVVVGVIVPNVGTAVLDGHQHMSNGYFAVSVEKLAVNYGATPVEIVPNQVSSKQKDA